MAHLVNKLIGQYWYDQLCLTFTLDDFPPLHSLTFDEWHWIHDDDLVPDDRPLTITTCSVNNINDWTIIMDEQKQVPQLLYSDIVKDNKKSSVILRCCHRTSKRKLIPPKKGKRRDSATVGFETINNNDDDDDDDIDDLWSQYKSSSHQRYKTKYHPSKRYMIKKREKEYPNDDDDVDHDNIVVAIKKKKSPRRYRIHRFVRHQHRQNNIRRRH
ncbi:uncharacterized protein BX664DRAFT_327335 [Halteromyces radiatus]|uniref:uncharacterized protein n=1 Tax=Halteromyces radiatus TaxID=101107 RepID=UPI0022201F0C|nr:uncharacterized protein BX664DRAFT_327335 [Halteromyces radiatus]KAI8092468.1 hypothetical protein BX664DRAFT_327335 [Halteromyces radiatus]